MAGESNSRLRYGAYNGALAVVKEAIADGADVESAEAGTGLTALHLASGRSHLEIVTYLVEEAGASLKPDGFGRWPSVIAAECRASEDVCLYIAQAEALSAAAEGTV